jgi:preprotein translocase subunit YajC
MIDFNGFIATSIQASTLAQDGGIGLPGNGTTGAPPAGGTSAPPAGGGGLFGNQFLLLLAVLMIFMIGATILGPRREKKRREAMLASIKKHDRVQTIGGVIGAIVELKPDTVVLKVDESANTRITFARSAIQQVLSSSDDKPSSRKGGSPEEPPSSDAHSPG